MNAAQLHQHETRRAYAVSEAARYEAAAAEVAGQVRAEVGTDWGAAHRRAGLRHRWVELSCYAETCLAQLGELDGALAAETPAALMPPASPEDESGAAPKGRGKKEEA